MNRLLLLGVVVLLLTTPARAEPQALAVIRVGTLPTDSSKALYYAKASGIFEKYGLDVQISIINSGSAGLAAVAGGSLDLVNTSILPVAQAHLRGVPFQIVAPTNMYLSERPATLLVTRMDASIRSGKDLAGKTITSPSLRDLNTAAAYQWIDRTGGDHRTVHFIELSAAEALPALEAGRIDGATLTTPFWDQAVASGRARVLAHTFDTIAPRFEVSGFVGNGDAIAKNPATMVRFARALHEAILYTNAHLDKTVDLVASYSNVDPAIIAKSVRVIDPEYVEARYLQPVIDATVTAGFLDQRFDAAQLISPTALKRPR